MSKVDNWCLISDGDGHWYVIRARLQAAFHKWLEYVNDEGDLQLEPPEEEFDDCRIYCSPTCIHFPTWVDASEEDYSTMHTTKTLKDR